MTPDWITRTLGNGAIPLHWLCDYAEKHGEEALPRPLALFTAAARDGINVTIQTLRDLGATPDLIADIVADHSDAQARDVATRFGRRAKPLLILARLNAVEALLKHCTLTEAWDEMRTQCANSEQSQTLTAIAAE